MCATLRVDPRSRWISGEQLTQNFYGRNSLSNDRIYIKLGHNVRLISANISLQFQIDF